MVDQTAFQAIADVRAKTVVGNGLHHKFIKS
jgi:hypothetical protein